MTIEAATQYITPGEKEYARQYYKDNSGTFSARMTADLGRFGANTAAIVAALGVWAALAADLQ